MIAATFFAVAGMSIIANSFFYKYQENLPDATIGIIIGCLLLLLSFYIINQYIITLIIDNNELQIKRIAFPLKTFPINNLKEIVLMDFINSKKNQITSQNYALILKDSNNKIFNIKMYKLEYPNHFIEDIKNISGLHYTRINNREYAAFKRGDLEDYRSNPYPKYLRFLAKLAPYFKVKYLLYPPLILLFILVVIGNIWFNLTDYQFRKLSTENYSNIFFEIKIKNNQDESEKDELADIYLTGTNKIILENILIVEKHYYSFESDSIFHYYLYPYKSPFYIPRLVNLDNDNEPEVIYKATEDNLYLVYDFDREKKKFISKSIKSFSTNFYWYIFELKSHSDKRFAYFIQEKYQPTMFIYFLILVIIFSIVSSKKRKVKPYGD